MIIFRKIKKRIVKHRKYLLIGGRNRCTNEQMKVFSALSVECGRNLLEDRYPFLKEIYP